jgi:hypothetical protein
MAAKLTRLTDKIAIQLHLVTECCIICSSRSKLSVRKLLDALSYIFEVITESFLPSFFAINIIELAEWCVWISELLLKLGFSEQGTEESIRT